MSAAEKVRRAASAARHVAEIRRDLGAHFRRGKSAARAGLEPPASIEEAAYYGDPLCEAWMDGWLSEQDR